MRRDAPVLAIDLGGTKLAAAAVSPEGEVLGEAVAPTDASSSPAEIIESLFDLSESAIDSSQSEWSGLGAVGVSFGGPVDYPIGRTVMCHHLDGWEDIPLREIVAERTGLPTAMDNDANAAGLGEATFGAARGCSDVLYLTVSTGIGAGLVLGGRVHRGAGSLAGELGHTLVMPDGPRCSCGRLGCLEAVACGPAIARAARDALDSGEASALAKIPRSELSAKHVAESAQTDPLAARIMERAGGYLGRAIAGAVNLIDPRIVVLGGGVSQAGEALLAPVRIAAERHTVPDIARRLEIAVGELGPRGGLLGAAALALREDPDPQEET
jgi:glucokinase